jgi:GcrA cell cycle regulator
MSLTYLENRNNSHNTPWTDELIERLKVLWAEGLSASQIADELKGARFTRMSVIGKARRLGLAPRKAREPGPPYLRKPRRRANGIPKPPAPPPRPPRPPPPPPPSLSPSPPTVRKMRQLTFAKLKPQHCKWPLGGLLDPPRLFCGADADKGEVYCPVHQRIARPGK